MYMTNNIIKGINTWWIYIGNNSIFDNGVKLLSQSLTNWK